MLQYNNKVNTVLTCIRLMRFPVTFLSVKCMILKYRLSLPDSGKDTKMKRVNDNFFVSDCIFLMSHKEENDGSRERGHKTVSV